MTIIAERIPGTWFDRPTMTGHPELVEECRNVCANYYLVMYSSIGAVLMILGYVPFGYQIIKIGYLGTSHNNA